MFHILYQQLSPLSDEPASDFFFGKSETTGTSFLGKSKNIYFSESLAILIFFLKSGNVHFFGKSENINFFGKSENINFIGKSENINFFGKSGNINFFGKSENINFFGKSENIYFSESLAILIFF